MSSAETDLRPRVYSEPIEGIGSYLRRERERVGLSLADAAFELRLPLNALEALERGEYSELPNTAFVKGYVKSYCKLLEVEVPTQFFAELATTDKPILSRTTCRETLLTSKQKKQLTRALLLFLSGVLLISGIRMYMHSSVTRIQLGATSSEATGTLPLQVENATSRRDTS